MREFLRAKIHRARVTRADLEYEGSFGIDSAILQQVGILPFESIEIYNVRNGERLRTYAIELPAGSGRFESNGAAAHKIKEGDVVIIACYTRLLDAQISTFRPKILTMDGKTNQVQTFREGRLSYSENEPRSLPLFQ